MENTNHDETLLARWLADELTEQELAELQQRGNFAELQAVVEGMKGLDVPAFSEQASWEKLQQRLKEETPKEKETLSPAISKEETPTPEIEVPVAESVKTESPPPVVQPVVNTQPTAPTLNPKMETPVRSINRRQWLYAAAAALAILLAALFLLPESDPSSGYATLISTGTGEQQIITLPDGSTAQLNAATQISFSESDWPDEREVYLRGEAYFKAKKGKTFNVLTDQGKVRVVGTVFNVFARENDLEVKCTEGKVQVFNLARSEKVLVKAGEQVSVVNGKMQRRSGIDFTPKWFSGESVFRSARRERVFEEIERQFGVTVVVNNLEGSPFSGKFVNDDLDKALRMISIPMELKYEVKNDSVWFSPK